MSFAQTTQVTQTKTTSHNKEMTMKQDWETFKDNNLTDRAEEKFLMLPRLYKSSDGVRRYPS